MSPDFLCDARSKSCISIGFRSEEHTSELQSRGLISYAVFCLKKGEVQFEPTLADDRRRQRLAVQRRTAAGLWHVTVATTRWFAAEPVLTYSCVIFFLMAGPTTDTYLFPVRAFPLI